MEHQELIVRLQHLREGVEQDLETDIAALETSFALTLSEVCKALGLTDEEHERVLGPEAAACVAALRNTRIWAVVLVPEIALETTAPTAIIPASGEGP